MELFMWLWSAAGNLHSTKQLQADDNAAESTAWQRAVRWIELLKPEVADTSSCGLGFLAANTCRVQLCGTSACQNQGWCSRCQLSLSGGELKWCEEQRNMLERFLLAIFSYPLLILPGKAHKAQSAANWKAPQPPYLTVHKEKSCFSLIHHSSEMERDQLDIRASSCHVTWTQLPLL